MFPFGSDAGAKSFSSGTHRTAAPMETIARLRPLLADFGITRIANLTGLDRTGIPVVMVCRPNARSSAVFHGKGIDIAAAKASGIMEAIETWHAEHTELPLRLGSTANLGASLKLIDVEGLPRLPDSRYHRHLPMLWVEGWDLIGQERVWLPFETVHADGTQMDLPGAGCFAASTNGLASGNHPLEALSHALCEVIERDGTSLWNRAHDSLKDATRLDLATIADGDCRAVLDRLRRADLEVAAWEITSDIGVPAFLALAVSRSAPAGHVGRGSGCHPMREIALLRALTEAAQVRTTYIVGSREDIEHADYRPATLERRARRVQALIQPVSATRDFAAAGRFAFATFAGEVAWILERMHSAGVRQVVAVDLSRPGYDVSVVRVVVPGLEGSDHHAGYAPGPRALAIAGRRA